MLYCIMLLDIILFPLIITFSYKIFITNTCKFRFHDSLFLAFILYQSSTEIVDIEENFQVSSAR